MDQQGRPWSWFWFPWPKWHLLHVTATQSNNQPPCSDELWLGLNQAAPLSSRRSLKIRPLSRRGTGSLADHRQLAFIFNNPVMSPPGLRADRRTDWPVACGMSQSHARYPTRRSPPPPPAAPRAPAPSARRPPSPGVCAGAPPAPEPPPASLWGALRCGPARCPTRASLRSRGGRPSWETAEMRLRTGIYGVAPGRATQLRTNATNIAIIDWNAALSICAEPRSSHPYCSQTGANQSKPSATHSSHRSRAWLSFDILRCSHQPAGLRALRPQWDNATDWEGRYMWEMTAERRSHWSGPAHGLDGRDFRMDAQKPPRMSDHSVQEFDHK